MSSLYLECYSGISGDMAVGALLDLGADRGKLERVLATIPAKGFTTAITTVQKSGINACDFNVILDQGHENHDHDMAYLYGTAEESPEHAHHAHHDGHGHGDDGHDSHTHSHEHRSLQDVYAVIDATQMEDEAGKLAKEIFRIVAQAEAEVHGRPVGEVHFHEVGAVDSIVDIIAAAVCYEDLRRKEGITGVIIPALYEGTGTVRCQHGVLPVPVPAVASIVRRSGIRLHIMPDQGEFVTPTGAAIAAALRTGDRLPGEFIIKRTGLGAGKRRHDRPGVVRAMLIE